MKNSYSIGYIENPFQIDPDFKPEYFFSEYYPAPYKIMKSIKSGKLVFSNKQIKIVGRKFSITLILLFLIAITPIIAILVLFSFVMIPVLVIDLIALVYFYIKKEEVIINIENIKLLKTEILIGPLKIKWITINFKTKDDDFWILPSGFKGNEKEVQEILTNFKNRGFSFQ